MDVDRVLDWYARVRRPLPWRETRDPYALLVSEVMLQQTQAARVVPYYHRFLERFPDPETLANAPTKQVLAAWSGLGYNRRALALQSAARAIADRGWPDDLTDLPGVGAYTAAAVAAFAWDRHTAAVDTNVRRVLERFDGVERPAPALQQRAADLIPTGHAATFNQAMMELGARVCRPRAPHCPACPARRGCATHAAGGPALAATPRRRGAGRFEDTDRWARGRVVAALVNGEPFPKELTGHRKQRVLAGLQRDGLIVRHPDGTLRLP